MRQNNNVIFDNFASSLQPSMCFQKAQTVPKSPVRNKKALIAQLFPKVRQGVNCCVADNHLIGFVLRCSQFSERNRCHYCRAIKPQHVGEVSFIFYITHLVTQVESVPQCRQFPVHASFGEFVALNLRGLVAGWALPGSLHRRTPARLG